MFVYHLQSIPVRENLHSQRNKPVNRKTFKYTLSKPERSLSMSMYPSLSRRKWLQYTTIALLYLVYPKQVEAFDTTRIDYISPKEAYQRLHQGNSKLVDVRSTEEYTSM